MRNVVTRPLLQTRFVLNHLPHLKRYALVNRCVSGCCHSAIMPHNRISIIDNFHIFYSHSESTSMIAMSLLPRQRPSAGILENFTKQQQVLVNILAIYSRSGGWGISSPHSVPRQTVLCEGDEDGRPATTSTCANFLSMKTCEGDRESCPADLFPSFNSATAISRYRCQFHQSFVVSGELACQA